MPTSEPFCRAFTTDGHKPFDDYIEEIIENAKFHFSESCLDMI